MRRWWEKVDLVIAKPASWMTSAQQDSPLRATYRTVARRCWSASAARIRGSWKSAAGGSTTSSITSSRIKQIALRSILVIQFEGHQTSISVELRRRNRDREHCAAADHNC